MRIFLSKIKNSNVSLNNTTNTIYDDSTLDATWIGDPWNDMKENIIMDSTFFALFLFCWLLAETKCVGNINMFYRLKVPITIIPQILRALRHYFDYREKMREYLFFILMKFFNSVQTNSNIFDKIAKDKVTTATAGYAASSFHAGESVCSLLDQSLSLLLTFELYRCVCHIKTRKASKKKLLVKIAILTLIFSVIDGCLIIVRGQVISHSVAFVTFLNVFPGTTGVSAVITFLLFYYAKCVLVSLQSRVRDELVPQSASNMVHVAVLVSMLASVQLLKLAIAIAKTIYVSFMIQEHFRCLGDGKNSIFVCYKHTADALSYDDYFSASNLFVLDYLFIIVRMVVEKRYVDQDKLNENSGDQAKTTQTKE